MGVGVIEAGSGGSGVVAALGWEIGDLNEDGSDRGEERPAVSVGGGATHTRGGSRGGSLGSDEPPFQTYYYNKL